MSLQWDWKEKIGELTVEGIDGGDVGISVYEGNALAIFINEFTTEAGEERYSLYSFFCDFPHYKRCAADSMCADWKRLTITRPPRAEFWKVIKDLATRGVEVVLDFKRGEVSE